MKKIIFALLPALALVFTACDRDPYPLELDEFEVFWTDADNSGTRNLADLVTFEIQINTTDPDTDDQYLTSWELSYSVNGEYGGVLADDSGLRTNGLNVNADIFIDKLDYPGGGQLQAGDELEFRLWAIDNCETVVEKYYSTVLEN